MHLSRRLKCTIVITCYPSSVRPSLAGSKISTSSTKSVVFGPIRKKQDGRPGLWLAEIFSTSPPKKLNRIQRNLAGSKISMSSTKFVFSWLIEKKNKTAALASKWLRNFRLFFWNCLTEFNKTWQDSALSMSEAANKTTMRVRIDTRTVLNCNPPPPPQGYG